MRILNKLKWFIKKLIIFLNYPVKVLKNNFDFDFLNTVYMNSKFIEKNKNSFSELNLENIKSIDLQKQTQLSILSSEHMSNVKNSPYFMNMNSFGYGLRILEDLSFKDISYLKSLHLYPANVFVLNEIKKLVEKKLIGQGLVIDYPSGIGNLFIYLEKFIDKKDLLGIDNFAQISKRDIERYQEKVGGNIEILTYEEFDEVKDSKEIDVIVSIELDLDLIIENILSMNSKFLIFETMYVSRYDEIINKLEENYRLYSVNESIIIYTQKI